MSVKDICELSVLLKGDEVGRENLESELLYLDGNIEVQEKRFAVSRINNNLRYK